MHKGSLRSHVMLWKTYLVECFICLLTTIYGNPNNFVSCNWYLLYQWPCFCVAKSVYVSI